MTIENVIENGFCVGCGGCKAHLDNDVNIEMQSTGFYKAKIKDANRDLSLVSKLCPFSSDSLNEDDLGKELYENKKHDKKIGYYNAIYTGHVTNIEDRISSSSGGLTTWFASKLLINNEIDAIVHVGESKGLFEYKISKSLKELNAKPNKKSRYYPVTFESLTDYLKTTEDRVLFIGIPCYVKAIRLMQKEFNLTNIKFVVSLLCGHMKSSFFAENIGWQAGILPHELENIDFRVKKEGYRSSEYFVKIESKDNRKKLLKNNRLLGSNWGHGFFKHKACDFCDDIAGELADVTFGDAWLPRYTDDYLGENIVVSRSDLFDQYIKEYESEVISEEVTIQDFYDSQAGNYRHRRDGLPVRIEFEQRWTPIKRVYLSSTEKDESRDGIYLHRYVMSKYSIINFIKAKKYNSYFLFRILMFPWIVKTDYLNVGLLKTLKINLKKTIKGLIAIVFK